jgi:hypothetical protein
MKTSLSAIALVIVCSCTPASAPRDGYYLVVCDHVHRASTGLYDPATGLLGTCLLPRDERHAGEPCELLPGATWVQLDAIFDGYPPYPGVSCALLGRTGVSSPIRPPPSVQCATGEIVTLPEACPTTVPLVPRGDPDAVPDENGCTPRTCESARMDCGIALDGCGHYMDCGECVIASEIRFFQDVHAAAASVSRGMIYAVAGASPPIDILRLDADDLSEGTRMVVPHLIRGLVVDDERGLMYVLFYASGVTSASLGVVDLDTWTLTTIDLGAPLEPPAEGPPTLEALGVSMVPGHPELLAVYLEIPRWSEVGARGRIATPLGLALYDRASGARLFMPDETNAPSIRSLFPGEDGVVYAGLDQPLFLRRYEIADGAVQTWREYAPNAHVARTTARWRHASYVGGLVVDAAGVVVDAASGEDEVTGERLSGFVGDPRGDRLYSTTFGRLTAWEISPLRPIGQVRETTGGHESSQLLWLGDRGIARLRSVGSAETGAPYVLTVMRSNLVPL